MIIKKVIESECNGDSLHESTNNEEFLITVCDDKIEEKEGRQANHELEVTWKSTIPEERVNGRNAQKVSLELEPATSGRER